jgi:hypothetical protein
MGTIRSHKYITSLLEAISNYQCNYCNQCCGSGQVRRFLVRIRSGPSPFGRTRIQVMIIILSYIICHIYCSFIEAINMYKYCYSKNAMWPKSGPFLNKWFSKVGDLTKLTWGHIQSSRLLRPFCPSGQWLQNRNLAESWHHNLPNQGPRSSPLIKGKEF